MARSAGPSLLAVVPILLIAYFLISNLQSLLITGAERVSFSFDGSRVAFKTSEGIPENSCYEVMGISTYSYAGGMLAIGEVVRSGRGKECECQKKSFKCSYADSDSGLLYSTPCLQVIADRIYKADMAEWASSAGFGKECVLNPRTSSCTLRLESFSDWKVSALSTLQQDSGIIVLEENPSEWNEHPSLSVSQSYTGNMLICHEKEKPKAETGAGTGTETETETEESSKREGTKTDAEKSSNPFSGLFAGGKLGVYEIIILIIGIAIVWRLL